MRDASSHPDSKSSLVISTSGRAICDQHATKEGVRQVQVLLNFAGFDAGKPDGVNGRKTRTAIREAEDHFAVYGTPDGCIDSFESSLLRYISSARRSGFACKFTEDGIDDLDAKLNWLVEEGHLWTVSTSSAAAQKAALVRGAVSFENKSLREGNDFIDIDCQISTSEWRRIQSIDLKIENEETPSSLASAPSEIDAAKLAAAQQEVAGLKAQLADITASSNEKDALIAEQSAELKRLKGASSLQADGTAIQNDEAVQEIQRQLNATLAVLADMQKTWSNPDEVAELTAELEATKAELAELETDVVATAVLDETQRRLDAANSTLADLTDEVVQLRETEQTQSAQIASFQDELARLTRQNSALNESLASFQDASISLKEHEEIIAALDGEISELTRRNGALNETLVTLRQQTVSLEDFDRIRRQLEAANEANADMRDRLENDYIPKDVVAVEIRRLQSVNADTQRQLDAANQALADLQESIKVDYISLEDFDTSQRQVSALNETVALLTERTATFRSRWLDAQRVYDAFIEDCRSNPSCARAMELD